MQKISTNKQARRDYEIQSTFEAGIVLHGWEVKAIKSGKVSVDGAFALVREGEVYVRNMRVYPTKFSPQVNEDEQLRERKVLLKKSEIEKIKNNLKNIGYTMIVVDVYRNDNRLIKVTLGLAKGKKKFDKRKQKKEKDIKRLVEQDRKSLGI